MNGCEEQKSLLNCSFDIGMMLYIYICMCFHISNYTLSNSPRLSFYLSLSLTLHSSPRRPPPTHLSFSLDVLYFLCIMCRCKREKGFLINFFPPLLLFSLLNFFLITHSKDFSYPSANCSVIILHLANTHTHTRTELPLKGGNNFFVNYFRCFLT